MVTLLYPDAMHTVCFLSTDTTYPESVSPRKLRKSSIPSYREDFLASVADCKQQWFAASRMTTDRTISVRHILPAFIALNEFKDSWFLTEDEAKARFVELKV